MLSEQTTSPLALLIDYQRESLAANRQIPGKQGLAPRWRGVGYQVGEWYFVTELEQVGDVSEMGPVTRVPKSASWLSGIVNVRGSMMAAIDLLDLLTQGEAHSVSDQVLVTSIVEQPIAIRVDKVHGLRGFDSRVDARATDVLPDQLTSLCDAAFSRGDTDWAVLDLNKIINSAALPQIETT